MATCNAPPPTEGSIIGAALRTRGTLTLPGTASIRGGRYGEEAPKEPGDVTKAGGQLTSTSAVEVPDRSSSGKKAEIVSPLLPLQHPFRVRFLRSRRPSPTVVLNGRWNLHFPLKILADLRPFPVGLLSAVAATNA
jgi:hypothetical protein